MALPFSQKPVTNNVQNETNNLSELWGDDWTLFLKAYNFNVLRCRSSASTQVDGFVDVNLKHLHSASDTCHYCGVLPEPVVVTC
jgi:hypothetical protein